MRSTGAEAKLFMMVLVLVLIQSQSFLEKVHVTVINGLGNGRIMSIHCQSRDDDLGNHILPDGHATEWSFRVNIWGTTVFYCDVTWIDSSMHHFDAYSHRRDHNRCKRDCIWMIKDDGHLYAHNPDSGDWEFMPFENI
ncbi:hypothetical protein ACH5RR_004480 [Cinchona calisaya]|uniref:S-protein homolog n=1 Tax=Cinchona calisaya TaxID=153742 RepID=A0ABD3AXS3_9GENT